MRPDMHFGILSPMLERLSDMFFDTDFLLKNRLKATQAVDKMLTIIIHGILKEKWKHSEQEQKKPRLKESSDKNTAGAAAR